MATLVRRERHPLWVALAAGFTVAAAGTILLGGRVRGDALAEGTQAASATARSTVSPALASRPFDGPLAGRRARILREAVERALASEGTFATARVFALDGRVLLDARHPQAGATAGDVASLVGDAAAEGAAGTVRDGTFVGYARLGERIVELTAAPGRFAPEDPWPFAPPLAIALAAICVALSAVTARLPATETEHAALYRPAIPRRRPAATTAPADVLPRVSVFRAGDLEIHHADANDGEPVDVREALTT